MSLGIFLIIILVAAFLLMALVSAGPKRGRRGGNRARSHGYNEPAQKLSRADIFARWSTIQTMADTGGGNGLRQAINEADKLLDHVMRSQGASGDTMGERLRSFQNRFSDRNSVWRAHKVRNSLAHEVGYDLVPSQAKECLRDFERALKDLGAI